MREFGFAAAVAALLVNVANIPAMAEEIRIEGGGAAISAAFTPLKATYEKLNGATLIIKLSSPVKALIALEKGEADVATAAVSLESMVDGAAKEGVIIDPVSLQQVEIDTNYVLAFVHKSNTIAKLSKEQLKGIFTGKITNWKALGGEDREIIVIWGTNTPGQNNLFSKEILDGEPLLANPKLVTSYLNIRETVVATPGAIGIDPLGFTIATANNPQIPPVPCPIILITKGKPSAKVQKLIDYYVSDFRYVNRH